MQICQKVVGSAKLYVAGSVLVGLATLFAAGVAGLGFKGAWAKTEDAYAYSAVGHAGQHHGGKNEEGESVGATTYGPYSNKTLLTGV